jgi:chemotaxis protein CheZ
MKESQAAAQLKSCLSDTGQWRGGQGRRDEIAEIVEAVIGSLQGDISLRDMQLYRELQSLAEFIHKAKSEIALVRPDRITDEQIQTATGELDAIVAATEQATGTILDSAEAIEELASGMTPEIGAKAADAVTKIYEACNFQDITGQRIGKVVAALKEIEAKVDALVAAFGDEFAGQRAPGDAPDEGGGKERDADLLNGPQLEGDGVSQADVDALFGT